MDSRCAATARQRGHDFEALFERMAGLQGLLARKIPVSGYFTNDGFFPKDSELDWHLIQRNGPMAFLDTKSYEGDRYARSMFKDHQVRTAATLNSWGVKAGFLVWFRKFDLVVFFTGKQVLECGTGSFSPEDGMTIGSGFDFDLKKLLRRQNFDDERMGLSIASSHGQPKPLERQRTNRRAR